LLNELTEERKKNTNATSKDNKIGDVIKIDKINEDLKVAQKKL
jgi:hypothetical protein